ncbi:MAG: N-methyl-L-tryptophan oxidase [Trueperaceae bacterium]|nr:MAG: N-methyl-L-tryptophan oxidase [Trueperaceae bacterium]
MERFDAIVIGTGVAGASAAASLARRGRVLVLEQFDFLHERGSSHGGSRIFRHAYDDERYVRLAQAADQRWRALEARSGERLLLRTGGLDLGTLGEGDLDPIEAALGAASSPVERLTADEVRRRFPAYALGDDREALFSPDAGVLAATRAVATLLRDAACEGAVLRERTPVTELAVHDDGVELATPSGRVAADRLVVAAGAWTDRLLSDLGVPLRVEQQQVLYLRVTDGRVHAPERMPVFIDRRGMIYGFPLFERPHALKVSDHEGAPTVTLEERTFDVDVERAADTARRASELLPGVTTEVVEAQTCLYTKTPDEHFVLDRLPGHPHVVVMAGFSGHGFKFGAVLGDVAVALLDGEDDAFDLSLFGIAVRG